MQHFITSTFIIVGLINFAPITGLLGAERLIAGSGIDSPSNDMVLLLQHRAVLFGIIGAVIILAAFQKNLRPLASSMALISMISFLFLFDFSQNPNPKIMLIAQIDLVATLLLILAMLISFMRQKKNDILHKNAPN